MKLRDYIDPSLHGTTLFLSHICRMHILLGVSLGLVVLFVDLHIFCGPPPYMKYFNPPSTPQEFVLLFLSLSPTFPLLFHIRN